MTGYSHPPASHHAINPCWQLTGTFLNRRAASTVQLQQKSHAEICIMAVNLSGHVSYHAAKAAAAAAAAAAETIETYSFIVIGLTSRVTGTICSPCWCSTEGRLLINSRTSMTSRFGIGLVLNRPPAESTHMCQQPRGSSFRRTHAAISNPKYHVVLLMQHICARCHWSAGNTSSHSSENCQGLQGWLAKGKRQRVNSANLLVW